ncbi:hypothetical protein PUNSTDRAFT_134371 [Punctularia strigosozonata HHB-11173 SS5]|uniref:uncharacterized protein n=1 Tax=Punctularia strigosozonata (strain HHB-11173) TaxID=741275 RepID=UPI000441803B|nr:uncharacterized protein PUNSTDRAFT_134371 [Punctularia strigosozonata HHB-11173 SS5]EIN09205.1 hypothetical protein PUNSTDRAFT_134371 [Punctularia strigosozonata HHB-11173 SS5]
MAIHRRRGKRSSTSPVGSPLGLEEIQSVPSTGDGAQYDLFVAHVPTVMGDVAGTLRAADALQFGTRNALISHISRISSVLLLTGSSMSIFVSLPICTSDETEAMSHRGSIFMKSLAIFHHAFVFSVTIAIPVRIPHFGPYSACFEEIVLEVPFLSVVLHGGWQFGIAAAVFIMIAAISDSISRIVLMRYPHHLLQSWAPSSPVRFSLFL